MSEHVHSVGRALVFVLSLAERRSLDLKPNRFTSIWFTSIWLPSIFIGYAWVCTEEATMEQKNKIGGDSLSVIKDKISELPDASLLQILSLLPTEQTIASSVLSKRWRSLWKMVPVLKFNSDHLQTSLENVYRSLLLHKAPVLESLYLGVENTSDDLEFGVCVGIAFARHVRKLVIDAIDDNEESVRVLSFLCSFNNTLEILTLKGFLRVGFPSRVCLKALKKLHLEYVKFKGMESLRNLLSGCPCLEDLVLVRIFNPNYETSIVDVPSLQRLTIEEDPSIDGDGGYVINAPSLKYLVIKGLSYLEFFLIENAPVLEAKLINVFDITKENILASLTSAKHLALYFTPKIDYPTGSIFYQLLSLELCTGENEWQSLLSFMLDNSPRLQILKLVNEYRLREKDCLVGKEWKQPKCVPGCLLFHLETFIWEGYEWQKEDEKEVATYILKNARQLKKSIISTIPIKSKEVEKLERRSYMLNELATGARASNSGHIVLESSTCTYEYHSLCLKLHDV